MEEKSEGILESIEKNSNAVWEQTDKIISATNAATSAAWGVVQAVGIVVGIVGGLGSALMLLYPTLWPKYLEWQAAQKTNPTQSVANHAQSLAENSAPPQPREEEQQQILQRPMQKSGQRPKQNVLQQWR